MDSSAIPSPVPERVEMPEPEFEVKQIVKSIWGYNKVQELEKQKKKQEKLVPKIEPVLERSNPVISPDFAIYNNDVQIIQLKEDKSMMEVPLTPEEQKRKERKEKRRERRRKRKKRGKKKKRNANVQRSGVVSFCSPKSVNQMNEKEKRLHELKMRSNEMPEDASCVLI